MDASPKYFWEDFKVGDTAPMGEKVVDKDEMISFATAFLQRDAAALSAVLHILLRVIEARLRERSGGFGGRLGAVSFVQRFGSALNAHVHLHCCVIDGVFAVGQGEQVQFCEAAALTAEDLATVQQQVRARGLRWLVRAGHLEQADARAMAGWHHGGGFSLDASVRIEGADRAARSA